MEKFQKFMEEKVLPIAMKLTEQRHLAAVKDGMSVLIPISIIGGLALVVAIPPIPADTTVGFLIAIKNWTSANAAIFFAINGLTLGIISVYVVAGVSYNLAKKYELNTITNVIAALFVFLLVAAKPADGGLPTAGLGATSMFSALIISLVVVEINRFFIQKNITIKMPSTVPPNIAAPFIILIPMVVNIAFFVLLDTLSLNLMGVGLTNLVYAVLQPLLGQGDGLLFIIFICMLSIVFWFFGIHGGNMIGIVTGPITTLNLALNSEAYASGKPLPKIWVGFYSGVFGDQLAQMALLISIFIVAKSVRMRSVAKVAMPPAVFHITEPLTFGLPTVLNIMTVIPIIICTILNLTVSYLLMDAGLIGKYVLSLPFTVPGPLNAWLSTMDIKALILWFALLPINILIMIPFMKTYDKQVLAEEAALEVTAA